MCSTNTNFTIFFTTPLDALYGDGTNGHFFSSEAELLLGMGDFYPNNENITGSS